MSCELFRRDGGHPSRAEHRAGYVRLPLGTVSERPKEHVSKTCDGASHPWVQIPPVPPKKKPCRSGLFLLLPVGSCPNDNAKCCHALARRERLLASKPAERVDLPLLAACWTGSMSTVPPAPTDRDMRLLRPGRLVTSVPDRDAVCSASCADSMVSRIDCQVLAEQSLPFGDNQMSDRLRPKAQLAAAPGQSRDRSRELRRGRPRSRPIGSGRSVRV